MEQTDKKEQFFVWLSSKVSASNLSDFYLAYNFIENYAKDSGILNTELISIKTKDEFISLSKKLQSSRFFRNVSSRDRFYIGQILIYLEEFAISPTVSVVKKEPVITHQEKTVITSKPNNITVTVSPDQVDCTNLQDYVYLKPYEYVYAGQKVEVSTWRMLYLSVVKRLLQDYPDKIGNLKNGSISRSGSIVIFDRNSIYRLRTAGKISDDLFIEVNLSAKNIAQRIKYLLDLCNIQYDKLIIRLEKYTPGSESAQKKTEQKSVTAPVIVDKPKNNTSVSAKTYNPKTTINNEFVDQSAFYTYLIDVQKMSESTCRGYVSALKRTEQFAREERLASCQLLNCSQSEARKTIDALNCNDKFKIFNNEQHHRFSAAIAKLIAFFDLPHEKTEVISSTDSDKTVDLESFLEGEEFAPLRNALVRHKITTIEGLKNLKLWAFMNRNNIYSIGARQRIFTKVNEMLYPTVDLNETQAYILHIDTKKYKGTTPAKAFIAFCADMLSRYPLQFRTLIGARMTGINIVPVVRNADKSHTLKVANVNAFVSENLSSDDVIVYTEWVRKRCGERKINITMAKPENSDLPVESGLTNGGSESKIITEESPLEIDISSKTSNVDIEKMEQLVLDADIQGITYEELKNNLHTTMVATKQAVGNSVKIVEVRGRLIHEEAFVDWEDGADQLEKIIEKLLRKNDGYLSSAQLYEYVKMEMNMFITDNDVNDERAIYDIAEHLFGKEGYHNKRYSFYGKAHISRSEHRVTSNLDIIRNYAADQGGIFSYDALVEYLQRIGISTGNLRAQMKIPNEPIFFYYDEGILMCADDMHIDDVWKDEVKNKIEMLLGDNGGYIILRSIPKIWLEQLPALPERKLWTPLLLQSILRCYGSELGAKTIQAMSGQSIDTLHTMLVSDRSLIQNFGDVIIAYLIDNEIKKRNFKAEDLRLLLVDAGIIKGNELIWNMPKALDKDERFAWDASGDRVIVEV